MENSPTVSVIVPVYNAEKYLSQCLDSLIHQTLHNIEIICIDDGSTDKSLSILNKYVEKDKRIIIVSQKNSGASMARNAGLDLVRGEYYMFVDSDDWVSLDICKQLYEAAKEKNADCVMCAYSKEFGDHSVESHIFEMDNIVWNADDVKNNIHRRLFGPIGEELAHPEKSDILVSPCMQLFKSEKFVKIRFHNIREIGTFEDGLYQIDVYADCDKFVYKNKPYYYYRKTNDNSITTVYKKELYSQWTRLFTIMENIINDKHLSDKYGTALRNRICVSIIGLGLNQIKSGNGIRSDAKELMKILTSERYRNAFAALDMRWFPAHWKIFFSLCKGKYAYFIVGMLNCIEFLRKRV